MGVFKKYSPMLASEGLRLYPYSTATDSSNPADRYRTKVCKWYDLNNTEWMELAGIYYSYTPSSGYINPIHAYLKNLHGCYNEMTAYATADDLEAFDVYDHTINAIGVTTQSTGLTASTNSVERVFAIRIVNNSTDQYVLNTDPIWRTNRSYFEDAQGEVPVTEEPLDWSTSYGNYYYLIPAGPITVKCIKFKRDLYTVDKGITSSFASKIKGRSSLYCAYFLDEEEWITIANGDSANLVIDFSSVST